MSDIVENKRILETLLKVTSSDDVADLIANDGFFNSLNCKWIPYGGYENENNAGQVEGQMRDSSNAIVEKITNSIDALLMRRCYEVDGVVPNSGDPKLPKSLSEALRRYFGNEEEINTERSAWAKQHLSIMAEGSKARPTLTIVDRGEGQSPDRLQKTIVNLNNSIKREIPFVFGKYHQGGSAAIRSCGAKRKCYQLVLSRRAETIAEPGKANDWGFTLVRRNYKGRTAYYEYCTQMDESTFDFPYDGPIKVGELEMDFVDGTLIRLYDYYLKSPSNITYGRGSLGLDINQKLQKSPLPVFLSDERTGWSGDTKTTIAGLLRRIEDNKKIVKNDITMPIDVEWLGTRNIRCIRLKHISDEKGVKSYTRQPEKIFYVENGLSMGHEKESFLKTTCRLPALAPYLVCYVDMSDIPVDSADIFHASREALAHTEDYKLLKERLKTFFENEIFELWEKEYQNKSLTHSNEDTKELDKRVEKAIENDPKLQDLLGIGEEINAPEKGEYDKKQPYEGEEDPLKFELVGETPRKIDKNSYAIISFRTEASDNLLTRENERYSVRWLNDTQIFNVAHRSMNRGIISFKVDCRSSANIDDEGDIIFQLLDEEGNLKFSQTVKFRVIEKPPYPGSEFPTRFTPQKQILKIPSKATRKLSFTTDVVNDYFTRDDAPGTIEFQPREDLELKKLNLKDGVLEIGFYTPIEKQGEIPAAEFTIDNAEDTENYKFDFTIPVEIVASKDSSKLNKPKWNLVEEDDWEKFNWDENDIARVDSSRTEGLIVHINIDSKPLKTLEKSVSFGKREGARDKYIVDCYMYALYLYFELQGDGQKTRDENEKLKDEDGKILGSAMRAIGKALPGMIRKIV